MSKKPYRFETLALHAGQTVDATQSRAVPVYRTSSYVFKNTQHAANLFALKELGNIYSRLTNPTTDVLEQRVSQLEGGAASVAVSSGSSAVFYSIITLAQAGDEIVSANNLYGGTYTQFDAILPKLGITTRFVDPRDPRNFEKAITDKTRAVFVETIGNPKLDFTDIKAVADAAHRRGVPLIVDGTFTTPFLLRTIEHGADIVINSLTKWIGGHGTAIGGIITDSGTFDWKAGRHPLFTEPDANYHGLRWALDLPHDAGADRVRFTGENRAAAQPGRLHLARQFVDLSAGARIAGGPHDPPLGERPGRCQAPRKASQGLVGALSRASKRPGARRCEPVS